MIIVLCAEITKDNEENAVTRVIVRVNNKTITYCARCNCIAGCHARVGARHRMRFLVCIDPKKAAIKVQ